MQQDGRRRFAPRRMPRALRVSFILGIGRQRFQIAEPLVIGVVVLIGAHGLIQQHRALEALLGNASRRVGQGEGIDAAGRVAARAEAVGDAGLYNR